MVVMKLYANTSRHLVKVEVHDNMTATFTKHCKFKCDGAQVLEIKADSFNELRDKISCEMYLIGKQSSSVCVPIDEEAYTNILNRIGDDAKW